MIQRCGFLFGTAVATDQVQRRHGHIEFRCASVLKSQEFGILAIGIDGLQTSIAADTVIQMHHRVADAQLGQALDDEVSIALLFIAPTSLRDSITE